LGCPGQKKARSGDASQGGEGPRKVDGLGGGKATVYPPGKTLELGIPTLVY